MLPLKDLDALFKTSKGYLWAKGPWAEVPSPNPRPQAPLFLYPCFDPKKPKRWLLPAEWGVYDQAQLVWSEFSTTKPIRVEWAAPNLETFSNVFSEIQNKIHSGNFHKIVPAYCWRGRLKENVDQTYFLQALLRAPQNLNPYFLRLGESRLLGLTPELLFSMQGNHLRTHAVAGTASAARSEQLLKSDKDLREHQFVANFLSERLEPLGSLRRSEVSAQIFGSLSHLVTDFDVESASPCDVQQLLNVLHPTPALGLWPSSESGLRYQLSIREQCGVDLSFGAPVGYIWEGTAHFWVAIRNILLRGSSVELNTGCGVIMESKVDQEWRELNIKRESVCKILNLEM